MDQENMDIFDKLEEEKKELKTVLRKLYFKILFTLCADNFRRLKADKRKGPADTPGLFFMLQLILFYFQLSMLYRLFRPIQAQVL